MTVLNRILYNEADHMKKRYLYALLFGLPGFFVAGMIALFVFGASMGILWLFIFGDNPWPSGSETVALILFVGIFLFLWVASIAAGYLIGGRLESDPGVNRIHILLSVGLTAAFVLFILFQQWSVGNLGPKSDSELCSDYCTVQGYSGSGTPPLNSGERTCSCFDNSGKQVLKVPLESIKPEAPK
jgi:hypothetical protein